MTHLRWALLVLVSTAGIATAQEPPPTVEGHVTAGVDIDPIIESVIQRITSPEAQKIVRGTVRRARRAIAIGPTVGGWGAYVPDAEQSEQAVTVGVGLEVFKIPVLPGLTTFKALIEERVRAKLRSMIVDRFKGVPPQPDELDRMAIEVFEEVKAELLGEKATRSKLMEKPRFSLAFEANRLIDAKAWFGRMRLGIGVWKVTVGASLAVGRPA